jgi:signal peptidase I
VRWSARRSLDAVEVVGVAGDLRRAAILIVRLLLVGIIGLATVAVAILIVIPRATHGVALTVLTGSMTPEIPVGSVVIDRPVDPGTLKVGDIATYQKAPGVDEYITHRIVDVHAETTPVTFTFRGDANRGADIDPIPATAIRGQVWFHVPYLGTIRDGLQSHGTRGLTLAAVLALLGGYSIVQIVGGVREGRRKRRGTPSAGDNGGNDFDGTPSAGADGDRSTFVEIPLHAFEGVDPQFVARLLQGRCTPAGPDRVRIIVEGTPQRLALIRELLEPYSSLIPAGSADESPANMHRLAVVGENAS